MDISILIILMSPFSFLGTSGLFLHFLFLFLIKIKTANRMDQDPDGTPRFVAHIWDYSVCLTPINQRTNGPVNDHLIYWPSKVQNIRNLENIW